MNRQGAHEAARRFVPKPAARTASLTVHAASLADAASNGRLPKTDKKTSMYSFVLITHSWLRWAVLVLGALVLIFAARGVSTGASWSAREQRLHQAFMGVLDTQFTLGALLYLWLSPITSAVFSNFGAAMKNPQLRFFGLEHAVTMLIAVGVAHIGKVRAQRKQGPAQTRSVLITQLLWLLLTLAAIPWPVLDIGRPLFRM